MFSPRATASLYPFDHQPLMAFGVQSIDRQMLKNNVVALAKAVKVFGIPATITTVETQTFSGHTSLPAARWKHTSAPWSA